MSIEKITGKIIGEAEENREQMLAEARAKAEEILAAAEQQAAAHMASEKARGLADKEKLISRRRSVSDIDCRKVILQEKQDLIAACFAQATTAITQMPEAQYLDLLVALGKQTGLTAGKLIFNAKERQAIGAKVVDALNAQTEGGKFVLAEETRTLQGGFLLQSGNVYMNNTIEALVEESRDKLSAEIAAMLFAE